MNCKYFVPETTMRSSTNGGWLKDSVITIPSACKLQSHNFDCRYEKCPEKCPDYEEMQ